MLFRQKYLSLFIVVMMFFVIASGGCGGGSSSSNRQVNNNPNQETPNTPTPNNPTPDNPTTEYDISVLQGTWTASNGTARRVENGQTVDEVVDEEDSGSYSFSEIQLNGDTATIFMGGDTHWINQYGSSGGMSAGIRARKFQRIDRNVWRFEHEDGNHAYTITITSPTTAEIEEEILETQFTWTASYTLTKQSATTLDINGTWRIEWGTLTYQDNTEVNYKYESSSSEEFTLTMSDIREGEYFIDVSGTGVFKKEGSPYIKAKFKGISENVRVVWGSSEYRESFGFGGGTEYKRTDTETYTYSAEFPSVVHDVSTASFRLSRPSRITYIQTGKSIERPDNYYEEHTGEEIPTVTVELYLIRVD